MPEALPLSQLESHLWDAADFKSYVFPLLLFKRLSTLLIVVDRIDLDIQITTTFDAADVPNMVGVSDWAELQRLIRPGRAQSAPSRNSSTVILKPPATLLT